MRDEDFADRLSNLEKEIIRYKSTQSMAGDSWKVYKWISNQTADLVIGPPVSDTFNQLYVFKYNVPGQIPNAFAKILVQPLEYNTGIFSSTFRKYDDPLAIYVRLKYSSANGVPAANAYIRLKVRIESPFNGSLQITQV